MKYRFLGKSGLLVSRIAPGMTEPAPGSRHFHRTQVDGPRFWNARGFRDERAEPL